jgi:hypothetical protein
VNTLHAGWNKGVWTNSAEFVIPPKGGTTNYAQMLGLKNVSSNPVDWSVPGVSMVGYSFLGSSVASDGDTDQNYQVNDTINYTHGRHNMRFGGEFRREYYQGVTGSVRRSLLSMVITLGARSPTTCWEFPAKPPRLSERESATSI